MRPEEQMKMRKRGAVKQAEEQDGDQKAKRGINETG